MSLKFMIASTTFLLVLIAGDVTYGATLKTSINEAKPVKRWEVRTAPLAFLAKWISLDAGYRFNSHLSTGPALIKYASADEHGNMFLPNMEGQAFGWYANYYFKTVAREGWYASTRAFHESYRSRGHATPQGSYYDAEGLRASAVLGYHVVGRFCDFLFGAGMAAVNHHVNERKMVYDSTFKGSLVDESKNVAQSGTYLEFKMGFDF